MPGQPHFSQPKGLDRAERRGVYNRFGGGRVHLGYFDARTLGRRAAPRTRRRGVIEVAAIDGTIRSGVTSGALLTFAGTGADWQAVDGLDCTLDLGADEYAVDWSVNAAWSAAAGIVRMGLEVDGALDARTIIETSAWALGGDQRTGTMWIHTGHGQHRFRLLMVSPNAVTATLTGIQRQMRVLATAT